MADTPLSNVQCLPIYQRQSMCNSICFPLLIHLVYIHCSSVVVLL